MKKEKSIPMRVFLGFLVWVLCWMAVYLLWNIVRLFQAVAAEYGADVAVISTSMLTTLILFLVIAVLGGKD